MRILGDDAWEEIQTPLWGPKSKSKSHAKKKLVYCIKASQIPDKEKIVYIGRQGSSERLKNFIQAYISFCKLLKAIRNKRPPNFSKEKGKKLKGEWNDVDYGAKFSFGSGLSHDLIPMITLYHYCKNKKNKKIKFEKFKFRFYVKSTKNPKKEEDNFLKKYEKDCKSLPPANTQ